MDELFEVLPCSTDTLKSVLPKKSEISLLELDTKLHIRYFGDYFNEIGAHTLVVENEYVDHDYSEDHAEYYVRCFKEYKRKCTRLHVFKSDFTKADLSDLLQGNEEQLSVDLLQESYLGFIVIKPLPKTVIGRTCLETYPSQGTRHFPITRSYTSNLFGINLKVENSLAFQEQDTVVAACATSALWSIFQGTGKLFQHAIPSPSAITKAATVYITDGDRTRAFPSGGLDAIEMARAIKDVGLEPCSVSVTNEYVLKSTAYAYLSMGIPMIMGFPLYDTSKNPNSSMGKHAVALTGYNLPDCDPVPYGPRGFCLRANKIDKLYAHDDQVGPFARMVFDNTLVNTVDRDGNPVSLPSISTSWSGSDGVTGSARAAPELLLLPLYHKIRITFGCIHDQIMELDALMKIIFTQNAQLPDKYEWDIKLTTVNKLKTDLVGASIDPNEREDLLISGLPKYLWSATVLYGDQKYLDILFDSTDIEQGSFVVKTIGYHTEFMDDLKNRVSQAAVLTAYSKSRVLAIIEWLRDHH